MVKQVLNEQRYVNIRLRIILTINGVWIPQLQPANKVVELMLKHIIRDDSGYQYFKAEPGLCKQLIVRCVCTYIYIIVFRHGSGSSCE